MIWLDVTKSAAARHRSGLTRVTTRLAEELGADAKSVGGAGAPRPLAAPFAPTDWYVTAEVFAPAERPGFSELLERRPCRFAAIYHDSIPLRFPHITWPQAVARHPAYLSMLAKFDLVWAVSAASREELLGFWKWQGRAVVPPVEVLPLGSDLSPTDAPPSSAPGGRAPPMILCVGILEPRKNQSFLLEVADRLWGESVAFELRIVGRVNPHFGKPVLLEIRAMQRKQPNLFYDGPVGDAELSALYAQASACVFPTIAEGCGLPLLEALWHGTPCVSSDLPPLMENAGGGGCLVLPVGNVEAWVAALRRLLSEPAYRQTFQEAAARRRPSLPTWEQTAGIIVERTR